MSRLDNKITTLDIINQSNIGAKSWVPSNKNINLEFPATNTHLFAPADGYYVLLTQTNGSDSWLYMGNCTRGEMGIYITRTNSSSKLIGGFVPCKKGDDLWLRYNELSTDLIWEWKFIYAEGSQDEYVAPNS